eukprot:jgi/Picre1/30010/NNA_005386.t1
MPGGFTPMASTCGCSNSSDGWGDKEPEFLWSSQGMAGMGQVVVPPQDGPSPAPEGDTGVCDAAENIVEIAAGNPDFSTLVAAVQAAGFVEALSAEGPLDVFAPTNQAFATFLLHWASPPKSSSPYRVVGQVLSYHGATLDVSGSTVTDAAGQVINILATVPASNGQIFVMTVFSFQEAMSLSLSHLPRRPQPQRETREYATLPKTLLRLLLETQTSVPWWLLCRRWFVEALSAEGPLDLLADTELLAQVLSYHVVVDGASCDTPLSGVVTTLQGATLDVSGSTVTDAAGQVINILAAVPASNGQIFVIDGVLLPQAPGGDEPVPEPPTAEAPAPEGDTGVCDASENIVEIAAGNPDFSTLVAAVQAAGFVEALSAEGPLDVFAPTNQAFADLLAALGITAEELLADTELLAQVLSYHVVVDGASCDTPLSGVVTTLQGATLDVSGSTVTDAAGQVINILAAVPASNGQIFVIDGVLLPQAPGGDEPVPEPPTAEAPAPEGDTGVCDATENIVEIAAGNPDFSTLVAAVQAAGFVEALSAEGPLDVFAPTNQAFADLLAALGITAEELLADTELLAQVLSYHVVVDGASCDTPLSGVVTTLQGATIDVSGSTVTDGSGQEINILDTFLPPMGRSLSSTVFSFHSLRSVLPQNN